MISEAEISEAHDDGYVPCSECGHELDNHGESGCNATRGEKPGCPCPIHISAAEVTAILNGYGFGPDGEPAVELHRPQLRDLWGKPTTDPDKAVSARCDACGHLYGSSGCPVWRAVSDVVDLVDED